MYLEAYEESGRISLNFAKKHVRLRRRGKYKRKEKNFNALRPLAFDVLSVTIGRAVLKA